MNNLKGTYVNTIKAQRHNLMEKLEAIWELGYFAEVRQVRLKSESIYHVITLGEPKLDYEIKVYSPENSGNSRKGDTNE